VKTLPDYLCSGLRLVFIGINPGARSAATGHHYAGPGNHFWPLLHESGLVSERLTYEQDARVLAWGIGLTNMVQRASPSAAELSRTELRDGAAALRKRLTRHQPRVACFNGKRIYEVFAGHRCDFGEQDERLGATAVYVMPQTSARTAAYQRVDKLRFFLDLKTVVEREERRRRAHEP